MPVTNDDRLTEHASRGECGERTPLVSELVEDGSKLPGAVSTQVRAQSPGNEPEEGSACALPRRGLKTQ